MANVKALQTAWSEFDLQMQILDGGEDKGSVRKGVDSLDAG